MNFRVFLFLPAMVGFLPQPGCQTAATNGSRAELGRQLAESRPSVGHDEKRYGTLPAGRPGQDYRSLRDRLKGKPGSAVLAVMGKPGKVDAFGTTESWDYVNAAYDPVLGRTVRDLTIWFNKGVVDYMTASY